jgi:hypothetical protein
MYRKLMFRILLDAGLSKNDVAIFVFLTEEGAMEKKRIVQGLKGNEFDIYSGLDHLLDLGIILKSPNQPSTLYALSFDEALGHLLEMKKEQAKILQDNKDSLVSTWRAITK